MLVTTSDPAASARSQTRFALGIDGDDWGGQERAGRDYHFHDPRISLLGVEWASDIAGHPDGSVVLAYPNAVLKGAELLGRHLAMFTDKQHHTGDIKLLISPDDANL